MTEPAIEVAALSKRFGQHWGIREVALRVGPGEIYGFLGPNGAGKSTTIRILMGLYLATTGTARVLGLDSQTDAVEIHRRTGYLPGDLSLHPGLTGRDFLERVARVRRLASPAYRDELTERFEVELDRPARTLSTGNRQKIGLVAAFMHRPELLVLDEPTSGLDPLLQEEFSTLVRETADDGRTVLLSSHDLAEVQRVVHRLSIIKDGRVVVTDTVEGLRARSPRTLEAAFDRPVDLTRVGDLDGVEAERLEPTRWRLTVSGSVAPVLRAIAELDPVDLEAHPADLDQLFLRFYRDEDGEPLPDPGRHRRKGAGHVA